MALNDRLHAKVLATKVIASVSPLFAKELNLKAHHRAIGLITSDCDDVTYVALDEATKAAHVDVVYGASFYAGATHASGLLSGEVIGILAGSSPADVTSGLQRATEVIENEAAFLSANNDDSIAYFSHVVTRVGSYLAAEAGIDIGSSLAYVIAPPLEANYALDAALKAANVTLAKYFPPPSETNFSGGFLVGSQAACEAAANAFSAAVLDVAQSPKEI